MMDDAEGGVHQAGISVAQVLNTLWGFYIAITREQYSHSLYERFIEKGIERI